MGKAGGGKGKKKPRKKVPNKKWEKYKIEGGKIVSRARSCPRCGPGIFLAISKDRSFCGKCKYTEFAEKKK